MMETNGLYVPPQWLHDPERGQVAALCGDYLGIFDPATRGPLPKITHWVRLDDHGQFGPEKFRSLIVWLFERQVETLLLIPSARYLDQRLYSHWPRCIPADGIDGYASHVITVKDMSRPAHGGLALQSSNGAEGPRGPVLCLYRVSDLTDNWGILEPLAAITDDRQRAAYAAAGWIRAQRALGIKLRFSPSYTGAITLRQATQNSQQRRARAHTRGDFAPMSEMWQQRIREIRPHYFAWTRAGGYPTDPTIHAYDRNWSFVSSAREVPLGEPECVSGYIPHRPGVYLIDAHAPASADPAACGWFADDRGRYPQAVSQVWAWEPLIRRAIGDGWQVDFHQGYAWANKWDLRGWQLRLWQARTQASDIHPMRGWERTPGDVDPLASIAGNIVKRAGVASIGRLLQQSGKRVAPVGEVERANLITLDIDETGATGYAAIAGPMPRTDLMRPEWWSCIIAESNAHTIAALRTWPERAVGAWIDCAYFDGPVDGLAGSRLTPGGWHLESAGHLIPREATDSPGNLVKTLTRAKRAGLSHAN